MYNLRKVTKDDISLLFEWANDQDERANSKNSKPIVWEDHVVWFADKMKMADNYMYILSDLKNDIGSIRFDKSPEGLIMSYFIDRNYRGQGFGKLILKQGMANVSEAITNPIFIAYAKEGNIASEKVLKQLGFVIKKEEIIEGSKFNVFYK